MARRKQAPKGVFVVVRRGWADGYGDSAFSPVTTEDDQVLGRPVAAFPGRAEAKARSEELERQAREAVNPFLFVDSDDDLLDSVTSLSPEEFEARLKGLHPGVRLPRKGKYGSRNWQGWWAKLADRLSEERRAAVWGLLDRLRFYAVLEAESE